MFEAVRLGLCVEILEALGHAVEAEAVQQVEGGMGEHGGSPSMEVAGAAEIGVVDDRVGSASRGRRSSLLARMEAMLL